MQLENFLELVFQINFLQLSMEKFQKLEVVVADKVGGNVCHSPGLGYPVVGDGMSVVVVGSDLLISRRNDILRARYVLSVYRRDCIMLRRF